MIIFRYLAKEICGVLLATSAVLLFIFLSAQFVHFMRYAAEGNLTAHMVILLLSLEMPTLLGTLLPLALFLGILLGFGRMYADSEMTVLFACGVSWRRIMKIVMSIATIIMVLVSILMLWVSPHVNKYAEELLNTGALSPLELILPGQFQEMQGGKLIFYAEEISKDHKKLHDIFVADPDDSQQNKKDKKDETDNWNVLVAKTGKQKIDKKTGDLFLVFNNGHRYSGIPGQRDFQIAKFDEFGKRISQGDNRNKRKVNAMPTMELFRHHKNDAAAAELQWRISMPIMVLVLAIMAVPLSRVRTRQGRYAQMIPAMLLYVIYGNFMFLARSWIKQGEISHALGMWWVHGIMLLIALLLFLHQIGWRRLIRARDKE
ncbi:MAG: LPS export ABC transporter permease LptF [Gammaproteobacteria bacterium]|nr:LPS export ABC transporter permease LptF [Gammaproteobacteria bacterium]